MTVLRSRDVDRALSVVSAGALDSGSEQPFGVETVEALLDAIPADHCAYVEWRFGASECVRVACSQADHSEEAQAAMDTACDSYPLRDVDLAASPVPLRITDVVSTRTFHRSAFYALVCKPHGFEHEMKVWLPAPPGHARYFELARAPGPNFSDRDRALLSQLRPHLTTLRSRWERRPCAEPLTAREREVLQLVAQGLTNRQIAHQLFISPSTVRTHLEHVYDKVGTRTRTGAVTAAFRLAL